MKWKQNKKKNVVRDSIVDILVEIYNYQRTTDQQQTIHTVIKVMTDLVVFTWSCFCSFYVDKCWNQRQMLYIYL